jgi:hypothetical protein
MYEAKSRSVGEKEYQRTMEDFNDKSQSHDGGQEILAITRAQGSKKYICKRENERKEEHEDGR